MRRRCAFCGLTPHGTRRGVVRCLRRALALVVELVKCGAIPGDQWEPTKGERERCVYLFRPGRARG